MAGPGVVGSVGGTVSDGDVGVGDGSVVDGVGLPDGDGVALLLTEVGGDRDPAWVPGAEEVSAEVDGAGAVVDVGAGFGSTGCDVERSGVDEGSAECVPLMGGAACCVVWSTGIGGLWLVDLTRDATVMSAAATATAAPTRANSARLWSRGFAASTRRDGPHLPPRREVRPRVRRTAGFRW